MRGARLLLALSIGAFLVLLVVVITGGFAIRVGPVAFTAHNWRGPALIAFLAIGGAALTAGPSSVGQALQQVWERVDRHATSIAVVIAAAAAGTGIAHGTYAASSSDASGYVSEARLLAAGRLLTHEPLARAIAWPNGTWAFAPLGYRPGQEPGELAPTYPAGLPLTMATVRLAAGEFSAYFVVPFLGALAVLCAYVLGAHLHSRSSGIAAAVLVATSPIFLFQLVQPMSDVPATAWWALASVFAVSPAPSAALAAGATAGLAVLTRPNLLPLAAVIAAMLAGWPVRHEARRGRRLFALATGMAPAIGALLLVQWRLYGHPFTSGYGSAADLFDVGNILPNLLGYAARIGQGETPAVVIAVGSMIVLGTRWRTVAWPSLKASFVFAVSAAAAVTALYLPYAVFPEWSYLRFLLPAFPLACVAIGALLTTALLRVPTAWRGVVFLAVLTSAGSFNVVRAEREQAFNLQRYESRYRLAGLYLSSALPSDAAIITVQHSGSARHYAGLPIVRWDLIGVDLDTALTDLRAARRHPFLLVEDWEVNDLRTKYPGSSVARLDWMPRAEFGDETRVHLYDPLDRERLGSWPIDRVH